ncbi:MAG: hypothetical protein M3P38_05365 [Chloroflexota bacterium]|nr:hypothetical protein [Chloroflexota bacterium]
MRYRQRIYAIALAGLRELDPALRDRAKFVTLTVPDEIDVPAAWFDPKDIGLGRYVIDRSAYLPSAVGIVRIPSVGPLAYKHTSASFNRLITALRQHYGHMSYFRVVEETQRGRPHYHLLLACAKFIPQRRLSHLAAKAGLGRITDIRKIENDERAVRYASKCAWYAAKSGGIRTPRGFRFYVASRDWGAASRSRVAAAKLARREQLAADGWSFRIVQPELTDDLIADIRAAGSQLYDEREHAHDDANRPRHLALVS